MDPVRHFINRTVVPRSLFWRTFLIVVLPLLILQVVLTYIFYNRVWDTVTYWLASGVAGEVAMTVDLIEETHDPSARAHILDLVREHADLRMSFEPDAALDDAGAAAGIDRTFFTHIDNKIVEAFDETLKKPFLLDLRFDQPRSVAVYVQLDDGVLRVIAPRKRLTSTTTGIFLAWMSGASVVLMVVAIYFMRLQIRPIRLLAKAMESLGKGRDIGEFKPRGAAEIRQAARAFNLMRFRLLRHITQRMDMLAAVSHDLRTPLTRMRLELEMMGKDDDPVLAGLRTDVVEMNTLVDTYLSFARGEGREAIEPTPITPILDNMRERAERAGISVDLHPSPPMSIPLRPIAFRRCLANLIDNACRYGRHIDISAARVGNHVEIRIDDDGPGIPAAQREAVFQPFVRVEGSRSRFTGGVGLGLAIARDVILSHGGEILLSDAPSGGLRALVRVPV